MCPACSLVLLCEHRDSSWLQSAKIHTKFTPRILTVTPARPAVCLSFSMVQFLCEALRLSFRLCLCLRLKWTDMDSPGRESSSPLDFPRASLGRDSIPLPRLSHGWRRKCVSFLICRGPEDTCFEFGVFPAILSFPLDYPLSPPKMRFTCEMFHPNSKCV